MLLARYALAIIDCERICTRRFMLQLRESLATGAAADISERAERLIAFAETRQRVRLDNCLLPAVRAAGAMGAARPCPLNELEQLARHGGTLLPPLRDCLRQNGGVHLPACVDAYCRNLAQRLDCEEAKILPLACHLLSAEDWFHVGAAFLRHDEEAGVSNYALSAKLH